GCTWTLRDLYYVASGEQTLFGGWDDGGQRLPSHELAAWIDRRRHSLEPFGTGDPSRVQRIAFAAFVGLRDEALHVLIDDASDVWQVPALIGGKHKWKTTDDGRAVWETAEEAVLREANEELGFDWRDVVRLDPSPTFEFRFNKWSRRLGIYTEYHATVFLPSWADPGKELPAMGDRPGHIAWVQLDSIRQKQPFFEELFTEELIGRLKTLSAVCGIPPGSAIPVRA
ncbi:MAG: NUDIX hydrolase, partial [Thermoanaerobaculia bacterium]|nr:NUDIX hydrolase [Thermoanaerobaculia bacterium]